MLHFDGPASLDWMAQKHLFKKLTFPTGAGRMHTESDLENANLRIFTYQKSSPLAFYPIQEAHLSSFLSNCLLILMQDW
jgi:hypothetical protein